MDNAIALFRQPNEIPLILCRILRLVFPAHSRIHNLNPLGVFIVNLTQALGKIRCVNYGYFEQPPSGLS